MMSLPPNAYRARRVDVVEHYRKVAKAGVPVVAYNNPFDTKVDLVPELLAELHAEGLIVAVKEFSGDVRRFYQLRELVPELDVLAGSDDVVLELALAGSPGLGRGLPERVSGRVRRAVRRRPCGRPGPGDAAVPHPAPAAALGLPDRVRAGHQAVDGPQPGRIDGGRCRRRAARWPRRTRRSSGRRPRRRWPPACVTPVLDQPHASRID